MIEKLKYMFISLCFVVLGVFSIYGCLTMFEAFSPYVEVYESYETKQCVYIKIDGVKHSCDKLVEGQTYNEHIWVK